MDKLFGVGVGQVAGHNYRGSRSLEDQAESFLDDEEAHAQFDVDSLANLFEEEDHHDTNRKNVAVDVDSRLLGEDVPLASIQGEKFAFLQEEQQEEEEVDSSFLVEEQSVSGAAAAGSAAGVAGVNALEMNVGGRDGEAEKLLRLALARRGKDAPGQGRRVGFRGILSIGVRVSEIVKMSGWIVGILVQGIRYRRCVCRRSTPSWFFSFA